MKTSTIDLTEVSSWEAFHDLFAKSFSFPAYYGRNMDAWIDCMEDFAIAGECLRLDLTGMNALKARCPEIYEAINECSAFINYRSAKSGGESIIALCYSNNRRSAKFSSITRKRETEYSNRWVASSPRGLRLPAQGCINPGSAVGCMN